jgi:HNH endonuclease
MGFTREWLFEQYITKGISANDIARVVGRDPKRVWEWIRNYKIPTRPRGHDTSRLCRDGSAMRGRKLSATTREKLSAIAKADGRMPFKKENGPPMRGKRGAETSNWKGGITPERQDFYASEEWKAAVKVVWRRADAKCERCGKDHRKVDNRKTDGFHIHHIDGFAIRHRRASVDNLILLCRPCHWWVHGPNNTKGEFLGKGH